MDGQRFIFTQRLTPPRKGPSTENIMHHGGPNKGHRNRDHEVPLYFSLSGTPVRGAGRLIFQRKEALTNTSNSSDVNETGFVVNELPFFTVQGW